MLLSQSDISGNNAPQGQVRSATPQQSRLGGASASARGSRLRANWPRTRQTAKHEPPKTSSLTNLKPGHPTPYNRMSQQTLLSVPPPAPYDVLIQDLTIGSPSARRSLIPKSVIAKLKPSKASNENGDQGESRPTSIVRNVVGRCEAGEVLAIIGGSGSGKTTLLNSIANRLGRNLPILSGDIAFRPAQERLDSISTPKANRGEKGKGVLSEAKGRTGPKESHEKVGKVIGYVKQSDYLLPHLTGESPSCLTLDVNPH